MTTAELIKYLLSAFSGISVTTVIGAFFLRKRTTSEVALNRATGNNLDITSQQTIIAGWEKYSKQLEERLNASDRRVEALEGRDNLVSLLVFQQTLWIQKSYTVMTAEQKAQVGEPPSVDSQLIKKETP